MDDQLLKIIEDIGFTDKESRIYLALLELSAGTVASIAKITNLKRPIIYVILESLIKKGYVTQIPNKKINEYQALDPFLILKDKRESIKNFSDMLTFFQTLHNKGKTRPKIYYIETKEGIWKIYDKEMNYSKDAFFITSYARIEKYFPNAVANWIKDYKTGKIKMKGRHLLANNHEDMEIGKKFKKIDQKVKFTPNIKNFNMDFTIYDNKLAITSLEKEPFMVLIESHGLVDSMKPIFEIAWKSSREI